MQGCGRVYEDAEARQPFIERREVIPIVKEKSTVREARLGISARRAYSLSYPEPAVSTVKRTKSPRPIND